MTNGLFRTFHRDERPLSQHLRQRFAAPLLREVERLPYEQLATDLPELARRLVDQVRVPAPVLLGQEGAGGREGELRPAEQAGVRVPTTRYYTAVQVQGDAELLEHWPDDAEAATELHPVDEGMADWTTGLDPVGGEYDYAAHLRRYQALLAQDRWVLGTREDGPHPGMRRRRGVDKHPRTPALFTFADLTRKEAEQVRQGSRNLAAEVTAGLDSVRPIIEAIAAQTRRFFDQDLPGLLVEHLQERRDRLQTHQAVLASLTFPTGWKYPEPALEPLPEPAEPSPPQISAEAVLGRPTRLADASYGDLLRTLRVWADAVERHPLAYRTLHEERVSDLIAATLNAALPGAHREVYNRGGKTDLFVRADTLSSGAGPARIFVCECKWWHGAKHAGEALEQLFGYLDTRDTAAVLLFLVRLHNPAIARTEALTVLQDHPTYVGQDPEQQVVGWPVLRFNRDEGTARVCVAFVDLPDLDQSGGGV